MSDSAQEVQHQLVQTNEQLEQVKGQVSMTDRRKRRAEIVLQELSSLNDDHNTFKSVGRMFLHTPVPKLRSEIDEKISEFDTEANRLQERKKKLEEQVVQLNKDFKEVSKE
eukprot:gb/GECH01010029.1/.p1 GENE.gb/GECH01010029.1/~~gb/GECH01010029.1/.p1  ORF type:complete len:111 (+),score=34.62 gb/GECH01010029.1/:1-333(+)